MPDLELSVENGKYTYRIDRGRIEILRFGEPWVAEVKEAGKPLIALLFELEDLRKQLILGLDEAVPGVDIEEVVRVWAVYSGVEGDTPHFVGIFANEQDADNAVKATVLDDDEEEPLYFDASYMPALLVGSRVYVSNDFELGDHEALRKHLAEYGVKVPT